MQTPHDIDKRTAVKGLINIALMEGAVLLLVLGAYFYTGNLSILIGGIAGTAIIFAPMFLRWAKEHGSKLKAKPGEGGHG
ncbi:hypothetical protein [Hyphococcus sp.]|uniref:hypothetical protein n=1 Tax=Hyphococcus sp. TaxID=2038636 RepID=UPI0035C6CC86